MMVSGVLLDHPFRSETMLFFRLSMFQQLLDAPQDQVCKCFVHESDISNGPEVRSGSCVLCFWKHLEKSFLPTRWNLPCVQNFSFMMSGRAVTILYCLAQSATIQPPTHTRPKLCAFLAA